MARQHNVTFYTYCKELQSHIHIKTPSRSLPFNTYVLFYKIQILLQRLKLGVLYSGYVSKPGLYLSLLYYFTLKMSIFTSYCTKVNFGPFYFINKLAKTATQKTYTLKFVSLLLQGKNDKNLWPIFFLYQDRKTATQKPTTRISVAFALGQKLQKNLFETNLKILTNLILIFQ